MCDMVSVARWLRRRRVSLAGWLRTVDHYGSLFYRLVGRVEQMVEHARKLGRRGYRGLTAASKVFSTALQPTSRPPPIQKPPTPNAANPGPSHHALTAHTGSPFPAKRALTRTQYAPIARRTDHRLPDSLRELVNGGLPGNGKQSGCPYPPAAHRRAPPASCRDRHDPGRPDAAATIACGWIGGWAGGEEGGNASPPRVDYGSARPSAAEPGPWRFR